VYHKIPRFFSSPRQNMPFTRMDGSEYILQQIGRSIFDIGASGIYPTAL